MCQIERMHVCCVVRERERESQSPENVASLLLLNCCYHRFTPLLQLKHSHYYSSTAPSSYFLPPTVVKHCRRTGHYTNISIKVHFDRYLTNTGTIIAHISHTVILVTPTKTNTSNHLTRTVLIMNNNKCL